MTPPPRHGFDRLAPIYRALEFLAAGGKMQRCRLAHLAEIPPPRAILIAGEGHGRFLPACVRAFPDARIVVVDASARMLEIARRKITASPRVEFVHADILGMLGPARAFDLIVTHFFLDCFPPAPLAAVIAKLGQMAAPKAHWLLADFEIPPAAGPARWRARLILAALYRFFRLATRLPADALVPPDRELQTVGFTRHRRQTYDHGLLKSEWWRRGC